jgi:hypothetical protein
LTASSALTTSFTIDFSIEFPLNLSATYLIRANPLLTYAQKPRTETEEKAYSSEHAKEAVGLLPVPKTPS